MGTPASRRTIRRLLRQLKLGQRTARKKKTMGHHPDRNAQFENLARLRREYLNAGDPVISIDTKKKELLGNFHRDGRTFTEQTVETFDHDFGSAGEGKLIPHGVYDLSRAHAHIHLNTSHDTGELCCDSVASWWEQHGRAAYPDAKRLLILCDGGGSNSSRNRLWKIALQQLANDLSLRLEVCHFPPGTSKWNKIEHRLFCFISKNWRGRPLTTYRVIVNLIAHTTTKAGLIVRAALDRSHYETGIVVSDEELNRVNIVPAKFHGEWNYSILPIT
jgi:hypothetical protein